MGHGRISFGTTNLTKCSKNEHYSYIQNIRVMDRSTKMDKPLDYELNFSRVNHFLKENQRWKGKLCISNPALGFGYQDGDIKADLEKFFRKHGVLTKRCSRENCQWLGKATYLPINPNGYDQGQILTTSLLLLAGVIAGFFIRGRIDQFIGRSHMLVSPVALSPSRNSFEQGI